MADTPENATKVYGEAPETDSSDEDEVTVEQIQNVTPLKIVEKKTADLLLNSIRGTVIDGEAPESDDSDDEVISFGNLNRSTAAYEVTEGFSPAKTKPRNHSKNVAINRINATCSSMFQDFIQAAAQSSSRQLIDTDHMLMHTQATLQQAGQAIKKFNQSSTDLSNRLDNILSANFIPPIKNVP